ncbi:hypothetical protein [Sphingosinicella sp. BN140058]|uniref:hypothetical protein n=1 Tax=Sphingosinicella sp. BN140058 TaxID=1892855 RepID=UPI0010115A47|nr:hypothetical protein [Sphingosinicella sp. BN140058]QAY75564.1 hypothetical protein ETR14_02745 [Sphingosinicella sp. BN140058]
MIQSIGSGGVQATSLGGAGGVRNGPGAQAAAAMSTLSSRIAATIARELGLSGGGGGAPAGSKAGDYYGVDALAGELANVLRASPTDAGRLSRALHEFAGEVASLLTARPHSSVLGALADLHFNLTDPDGRAGCTDADYAVAAVEAGVFRLREDAPWKPEL